MKYEEVDVTASDALADGEMKAVAIGETSILLARVAGRYYAVGAECTHYHAPLAEGVLDGSRLVCPWHHACFDVTTGALEEPPALDALPRYEVVEADGRVSVRIPVETDDRMERSATTYDPEADGRTFAVVGAGAAGYAAAQTLRDEGFRGRVVLITREDRSPYDRPNLSKDYLAGSAEPEWMPIRPDAYFEEHAIELLRGKEVVSLDAESRTIAFADGEALVYDAALVATGGVARKPPIPGIELRNVFTLRTFDDADAIVAAIDGATRAVVVGASFIGMEAAASLVARGLAVTVVAPGKVPFEKSLGPEIGAMFRRLHEEHGVRFELGTSVARFEGDGTVEAVALENGSRIDADLAVVGVGVRPATGFLRGVALHDDGSVDVDEYLGAADGLYAAGDVARFPDPRSGGRVRIEHWRTAEQQGMAAARNMLGRSLAYTSVPFFWTNQYGEGVQYVGHASTWDEIVVDGDVDARDFLAYYVEGDRILAVAGSGRDRQTGAIAELMRLDRMPAAGILRSGAVDWPSLLATP
jgi:NADPH-dependent 2,4-dienoyl-CoA reductase/sulfur reductase-like enzyme/nitrite reductase/ring-hydroxylating ferredoxin subunit